MIPTLRPYQARALDQARALFRDGHRSVVLVLPTGGGKSVTVAAAIAQHLERGGQGVVVVVHRVDLVEQMAAHLRRQLGEDEVGVIRPGANESPHARVQVSTIQTLLRRGVRPPATLIVLDEAHHYVADLWRTFRDAYPSVPTIGLTATPERQDGRALGDVFDGLVVGAHYSELLDLGFLTPCVVYAPPEVLEGGLALQPLDAYQRYTPGRKGFAFFARVAAAEHQAELFTAAGIPAAAIHQDTPKGLRLERIAAFKRGDLRMLTNVGVLTEGFDVPDAEVCLLACNCAHAGGYLQRVGRVLRPAPGKVDSAVIDLTGAVYKHGLPTIDREYSLDGKAIRPSEGVGSLTTCQQCGAVYASGRAACPVCGFTPPKPEVVLPYIHNVELRAIYAGKDTPVAAKRAELERLVQLASARNYGVRWAAREYRRLFNEDPAPLLRGSSMDVKRAEYDALSREATLRGYKAGWVAHRYRAVFGVWPRFGT